MTDIVLREPLKVIADIISSEMSLNPTRVIIYNEKINIPPDDGLWIVIGLLSVKTISIKSELIDDGAGGANEEQSASIEQIIQIDIMSSSAAARIRQFEVLMALNSIYAQQQCELYNMKIARIPTAMNDTSSVENTKILNRYSITIIINAVYNKTKTNEFYDTLQEPNISINI